MDKRLGKPTGLILRFNACYRRPSGQGLAYLRLNHVQDRVKYLVQIVEVNELGAHARFPEFPCQMLLRLFDL